jgi:hypothetical protein
MTYKTKVERHHHRPTRPNRASGGSRLAWAAFLVLAFVASWYGMRLASHKSVTAITSQLQKRDVALLAKKNLLFGNPPRSARLVYPYSVVPGGIASLDELKRAIAADPTIAAHYAGFDLSNARVTSLGRDRLAYVSYRKDNRIFWTRKKVRLAKSEQVITDGVRIIRERCGNLVSEWEQSPTSPSEPPAAVLDSAPPSETIAPEPSVDIAQTAAEAATPSHPAISASQQDPGNSFWYVPPILLSPGGGGGGTSTGPSAPPVVPTPQVRPRPPVGPRPPVIPPPVNPPPVIAVPEPSTLLLLLAGLPLLWLFLRKHGRAGANS